jgi:hypothetical protein
VNTTLVVNASPSDTSFHFIADWQYKSYTFGSPTADTTAENVALLFMILGKNVFGYNKYKIVDTNLFRTGNPSQNLNEREIRLTGNVGSGAGPQGKVSTVFTITICNNLYYCPPQSWNYCNANGGCDYMNCPTGICLWLASQCYDYEYDNDPGTGGGTGEPGCGSCGGNSGGSGGSGSGGGGWTPPECPGGQVAKLSTLPGCEPGWNPPPIIISTPSNVLPYYIISEITKPCLDSALRRLTGGQNGTFFRQIFNVFDTATNLHLLISEDDLTNDTAYGTCAYYDSSGVGQIADIKLDTIKLMNCSQEWMSYVIIHEVAHAGMFTNIINWDSTNTQHSEMISDYLTVMASNLTAVYPGLSLYDAYSICYAGFNNGVDGSTPDNILMTIMLKVVKQKLNNNTVTTQQLITRGGEYSEFGSMGRRPGCN